MGQKSKPRAGTLQFSPRKRARKLIPRVRSWSSKEDGLLGFIGYKVGSFTAITEVTDKNSRLAGKEKSYHATLIEVPPMILRAIRIYKKNQYGSRVIGDYSNFDKIPETFSFGRLTLETQPKLAGFPKKRSELVEVGFGGSNEQLVEFAKANLNKEIKASELFKGGEFIDVTSVSIGRGFQGVVKRFGIPLLPSKTEKSRRKVGSLGSWTPARTDWRVAMAGQTGYHVRTDYNKEILVTGTGNEVNPKAGWPRYGLVKSEFVVLKGSVPGPVKRSIWLRKATRAGQKQPHALKHLIYENEVMKL
ncbi:MAG: 50S ribosomal protein L3 [Candidatus Altiarchaeota archaeon]|nr:50S ribosomal protein L3 [Candidatus Altiarchaeota archaeon]